MKLKFTLLSVTCIVISMLVTTPSIATEKKFNEGGDKEKTETGKKQAKKTSLQSSRNNTAVKIYPDILKRSMHVVAKENDGKEIDFFVFDLEGTLLNHYKMVSGDRKEIDGLQRGKYVYHVFAGDEETATGGFEIR